VSATMVCVYALSPNHALSEVALFRNALCGRRRLQGLCPRTPRIYRLVPLPMLGSLRETDERGMRSIPLIDRSRPLSRRSGCFPLPYPPLSSGSFYCGGIKKRIFAVGSEGMTLKPRGMVQAKNHLSPQGGTQHAE
jgi:hypothetical protein